MKKIFLIISTFSFADYQAQTGIDTTLQLKEVSISAYPSKPVLLLSTSSVSYLNSTQLIKNTDLALTHAINSISGIRMEERSPGSYRLSIRGSLLRSPFGVRNIKVYLDEFPLTDASGNTYLNLTDPDVIRSLEVIKGPEGSTFGANTGGVLRLGTEQGLDSIKIRGKILGGSFGSVKQYLGFQHQVNNYSIDVFQGFQRTDGYRNNSSMNRIYLQLLQKFKYKKGIVKLLTAGSDLHYETPGGLTSEQASADPRSARPSTIKLPGAEQQKAGIYNSTVFGGISNEYNFSPVLKHYINFFGSYTDLKNPFITNYETRFENTFGLRTFINLKENLRSIRFNWNIGFEGSETTNLLSNFHNDSGTKGELNTKDEITAGQYFLFSQLSALLLNRLNLEAALSMNNNYYEFRNLYPGQTVNKNSVKLPSRYLPRFGISYRIYNNLVWRASASKGYSPPTISELRPSDNVIYYELMPEYGWNYETGLRYRSINEKWSADLVYFRFDLQDAIVRRLNEDGAEFFVNAGGTKQEGVEAETRMTLMKNNNKFLKHCEIELSYTLYYFHFVKYQSGEKDYSSNALTGIPSNTFNGGISLSLPASFAVYANYNYTGRLPLNDSNTDWTNDYHLLRSKITWTKEIKRMIISLFAGIDNILDEKYSLGNDINAAAGRYYNPAPVRNFYGGIAFNVK